MRVLFIVLIMLIGGGGMQAQSFVKKKRQNYTKIGRSGAHWEFKKYDHAQRKKLTRYKMGWGVNAGSCPVYSTVPVKRATMKRYHYFRASSRKSVHKKL